VSTIINQRLDKMSKTAVKTLNIQEIKERIEGYINMGIPNQLPQGAGSQLVEIYGLLDEINHLLIPVLGELKGLEFDRNKIVNNFSPMEWEKLSEQKKRYVVECIQKELDTFSEELNFLRKLTKKKSRLIESVSDSLQDKICELSEFNLSQRKLRESTIFDSMNLGAYIKEIRQRNNLSEKEYAKLSKVSTAKQIEFEKGELQKVEELQDYINKMLLPAGGKCKILFQVEYAQ
jgi:DNA-binding transcriptional regulator YiaG